MDYMTIIYMGDAMYKKYKKRKPEGYVNSKENKDTEKKGLDKSLDSNIST